MQILLFLFIGIPIIEIYLLAWVGSEIGFLNTLGIVIATGVIGASLAKSQGMEVLRTMQSSMHQGALPTGSLVDGALILVAGALLITPGVLTDVIGFLLLIPMTRWMARGVVVRWAKKKMARGQVHVWGPGMGGNAEWTQQGPHSQGTHNPSEVTIEGEFKRLDQGEDSSQE